MELGGEEDSQGTLPRLELVVEAELGGEAGSQAGGPAGEEAPTPVVVLGDGPYSNYFVDAASLPLSPVHSASGSPTPTHRLSSPSLSLSQDEDTPRRDVEVVVGEAAATAAAVPAAVVVAKVRRARRPPEVKALHLRQDDKLYVVVTGSVRVETQLVVRGVGQGVLCMEWGRG